MWRKVVLGTSDCANYRKNTETLVEKRFHSTYLFLHGDHTLWKMLVWLDYFLEEPTHLISLKKTDLFHKFIPGQTKYEQTHLKLNLSRTKFLFMNTLQPFRWVRFMFGGWSPCLYCHILASFVYWHKRRIINLLDNFSFLCLSWVIFRSKMWSVHLGTAYL